MATREPSRGARWPSRLLLFLSATCTYMLFRSHGLILLSSNPEPAAIHSPPSLSENVREDKTHNVTTTTLQGRDDFVIDILSIGSTSRLSSLKAQKATFGSHVSVRHFFNATESDDADPDCASKLSLQDVTEISNWCRGEGAHAKQWNRDRQFVMSYLKLPYANPEWLLKKKHPQGWMCAQSRPAQAFYKTLKTSYAVGTPLPDYLLIVDDDTYYNMEIFVDYLRNSQYNYQNSSVPIAMAGCLVRSPIDAINLTIPFGGYGLTLSKGYLKKVMEPIRCTQSRKLCQTIRKTSHLDERPLFSENMSISDVMYKYATNQPFVNHHKWKAGFCLHSDWLWSIFTNFYSVTRHNVRKVPFFDDVPQERMEAYLDSEFYVGNPNRKSKGTCDFSRDFCHSFAPVCHYASPESMHALHALTKQRHPTRFQDTLPVASLEVSSSQLVIDVLLLESESNVTTLNTHRDTLSKNPSVRKFKSMSVSDDSNRPWVSALSSEDAMHVITQCAQRHYMEEHKLLKQTQSFFARKDIQDKVRWFCRQILPLAGLVEMLKQYVEAPMPDYLLILREGTYFNVDILREDLLYRPDRPGWVQASTDAWAISGCVRNANRMPFKFPLLGFGLLLSRSALERLNTPLFCHGQSQHDSGLIAWTEFACDRIEENRIGEKALFQDGMSLSKLLYCVGAQEPTGSEVPIGVCIRDDWWLGYLIHTYNVTDNGLRAYSDSIHVSAKKVSGLCSNIGDIKCNPAAPYCQKISADTMTEYSASIRHIEIQRGLELSSKGV